MAKKKIPILTPAEAAAMVRDEDTLSICGAGGGITEPTALILALAERHRETNSPSNLTLLHVTGLGDRAEKGISPLAQPGLFRRVIGGHWDQSPRMAEMAARGEFEAWNIPMGIMSQLNRAMAAKQPGLLSKVGLGTFEDPRQRGGKLNDVTQADLIRLMELDGEEWLFYQAVYPTICFLRGSTADAYGNISMEDDIYLDVLDQAMAVHNNGGRVIFQVSRMVEGGSIPCRQVIVPCYLVDAVVVEPTGQLYPLDHLDQYISGQYRMDISAAEPIPLNQRKLIARRALALARPGDVGNLGVGVADGISVCSGEEGLTQDLTLTVELGVIGGVSQQGVTFGASVNMDAMLTMPNQFAFYDGGGLNIAYLSFAELDQYGNVNVSRFGGKIVGTGGFINICQNTKRIVFCGTLTAGGLKTQISDDTIHVLQEGRVHKCVRQVEEITFNGPLAFASGQTVYYVTERALFRLAEGGVELCEYAAGMDIEKDIIAQMDFRPLIAADLKEMDPRLFRPENIGLKQDWGC